jgi:hypothetical protein
MKRLLSVAKWVPLGLTVLLLIAWPISVRFEFGFAKGDYALTLDGASITLCPYPDHRTWIPIASGGVIRSPRESVIIRDLSRYAIPYCYWGKLTAYGYWSLPIPLALSLPPLVPLRLDGIDCLRTGVLFEVEQGK